VALERRDPLPPGFYSIDVVNENEPEFETWAELNSAKVLRRAPLESGLFELGTWYNFQTLAAAPWPREMASRLGWPTIEQAKPVNAPAAPFTMTDAAQASAEAVKEAAVATGSVAADIGFGLALLGALYLIGRIVTR